MFAILKKRFLNSDFCQVFNFRTPESKGSSLLLIFTFLANLASVFISGVFYTSFLVQNGIDIVRVGVISFATYLSWFVGLLSPKVLRKFKRRRALLLINDIFYYCCIILATTVMPNFVKDPNARTLWFIVFMLLGNTVNALFGPGAMAWHIHFIPEENEKRNIYFSFENLVGSLVSTAAAVVTAVVADSMTGGAGQDTLIVTLRYVAFVLFIVGVVLIYGLPKEWPYEYSSAEPKLRDVIRLPLQQKKFLCWCGVCFIWSFIANINSATWDYYLLDTVGMPYLMTLTSSIFCLIGNLFLLPFWRRLIARFGWHKMLCVCFLLEAVCETTYNFTTSTTLWWYVLVSVYSGLIFSGLNLTYANIFYANLPKGDRDVYYLFWNFGANILAFLGASFGTFFLSIFQKIEPVTLFGLPFYGSQFLPWVRFVLTVLLAVYIWKITPYTLRED